MTAVHQFVPALVPRDATGNHTLALQESRRAGWRSDLYAEAVHADLADKAAYFEEYPERAEPGDLLLYHLGTASPLAEFLLARPERLVLDYHNITPASYYEGWEDPVGEKVALARVEAAALPGPPWASPTRRSTPSSCVAGGAGPRWCRCWSACRPSPAGPTPPSWRACSRSTATPPCSCSSAASRRTRPSTAWSKRCGAIGSGQTRGPGSTWWDRR